MSDSDLVLLGYSLLGSTLLLGYSRAPTLDAWRANRLSNRRFIEPGNTFKVIVSLFDLPVVHTFVRPLLSAGFASELSIYLTCFIVRCMNMEEINIITIYIIYYGKMSE